MPSLHRSPLVELLNSPFRCEVRRYPETLDLTGDNSRRGFTDSISASHKDNDFYPLLSVACSRLDPDHVDAATGTLNDREVLGNHLKSLQNCNFGDSGRGPLSSGQWPPGFLFLPDLPKMMAVSNHRDTQARHGTASKRIFGQPFCTFHSMPFTRVVSPDQRCK